MDRPVSLDADHRSVFRALPGLFVLLTPELSIIDASDEFLRATMTKRDDIVGRGLFDVFPDNPDERDEATGETLGRASFARVRATRQPHTMGVLRFPIRRTDGTFEERYWAPHNLPVLDDRGEIAYLLQRVEDVTEVVRLRREALERDHGTAVQRIKRSLDLVQDAVVIAGEDGRIHDINAHAEAMFGYTRDELVGQPLELLVPERFRAAHRDHLSQYFTHPMPRAMSTGAHLYGRRKDASEVPIDVSLTPQRTAEGLFVSATLRDISDTVRLEERARLGAERLGSAVDSIEDAFGLFDSEGRLITCNAPFRRLLHLDDATSHVGTTYEALLDRWLSLANFPDEATRAAYRAERLAAHARKEEVVIDATLADGRRLRVVDRRTPEGGLVKTIYDRTDDDRRARELVTARSVAEAASTAKSEFLSSMSHELRTPLNAILGFAQLLQNDKREPLSRRHFERVEHILRGGEHLLRLINEILDLSRIEAGQVTISLEPVELGAVLDELQRTLAPLAEQAQVELAIERGEVPSIIADRTRIAQILLNFGSNAIKYNRPHGQVRLRVQPRPGDRVRISVEDTGLGIPLEQQAKLFQPFQRAGQENSAIEGTGIGLVITKRLAEMMNGSVGFSSTSGEGSAFWVEMPRHLGIADRPVAKQPPTESRLADGARARVLYVEDNPANVDFMRDMLGMHDGLELTVAATAEAGIECALAERPSVIVMDINLPGMSGLEALGVLRERAETAPIPVIALTAAAQDRDRRRGIEAGFAAYLSKPVDVDEFLATLQRVLAQRL